MQYNREEIQLAETHLYFQSYIITSWQAAEYIFCEYSWVIFVLTGNEGERERREDLQLLNLNQQCCITFF